MATYYVYVIYSESTDAFYIGQSVDLEIRLQQHIVHKNEHSNTSKADDWILFFYITCECRRQAIQIETHIKKMKSRKYFENLKKHPEISSKLLAKYACSE